MISGLSAVFGRKVSTGQGLAETTQIRLLIMGSRVRVPPGSPSLKCSFLLSTACHQNCPARYPCWTKICSPSALNELLHRLARHALAVGCLRVTLYFRERGVPGDRCNLICTASDLSLTTSASLA